VSSKSVNCPNCNAETEAVFFDAHDDLKEESQCGECGAEFSFTINIEINNVSMLRMMPFKCQGCFYYLPEDGGKVCGNCGKYNGG